MGWATGSRVAEEIWTELKPHLTKKQQKQFSKIIYNKFTDYDADDWQWEEGMLMYDAYKLNNPEQWEELNNEYIEE